MFKYISVAVLLGVVYAGPEKNPLCTSSNGYYPVDENCDAYIECKDYIAREKICPDGLHYNPQAEWPAYPCAYPMDAPCHGRGAPQQAQPTADCPHQHGFFPLPNADAMPCDSYRMCVEGKAIEMQCPPGVAFNPDSGRCDWHVLDPSCGAEHLPLSFQSPNADAMHCGSYRMCVEGKAIEMQCPPGLAFNSDNVRCDWPDLVPSCNAEQYLGFQCPPAPIDDDGNPMDVVNYAYKGNCYAFYSCEHGRPRFLTCDQGFAFDSVRGHCVNEKEVQCAVPLTQH